MSLNTLPVPSEDACKKAKRCFAGVIKHTVRETGSSWGSLTKERQAAVIERVKVEFEKNLREDPSLARYNPNTLGVLQYAGIVATTLSHAIQHVRQLHVMFNFVSVCTYLCCAMLDYVAWRTHLCLRARNACCTRTHTLAIAWYVVACFAVTSNAVVDLSCNIRC